MTTSRFPPTLNEQSLIDQVWNIYFDSKPCHKTRIFSISIKDKLDMSSKEEIGILIIRCEKHHTVSYDWTLTTKNYTIIGSLNYCRILTDHNINRNTDFDFYYFRRL